MWFTVCFSKKFIGASSCSVLLSYDNFYIQIVGSPKGGALFVFFWAKNDGSGGAPGDAKELSAMDGALFAFCWCLKPVETLPSSGCPGFTCVESPGGGWKQNREKNGPNFHCCGWGRVAAVEFFVAWELFQDTIMMTLYIHMVCRGSHGNLLYTEEV